jgi:hypothetical protein
MLQLTNLARASHGASALVLDDSLNAIADQVMSGDMGVGSTNCMLPDDYKGCNGVYGSNTYDASGSG